MLRITFATRKYQKELYTFVLNLPSFEGEKGCCNVEISPYITVDTPENWCGYNDTFMYNSITKNGYYLHRVHPNWITKKIIEVCNRYYTTILEKFYNNAYDKNGNYKSEILQGVEFEGYCGKAWCDVA